MHDPEITLLEVRQKLEAEESYGQKREREQHAGSRERQNLICYRELGKGGVDATQNPNDERLRLPQALMQQVGAEGRNHGKGRNECASKRIGIGPRHRAEYVTFDPAQREQRNEADDDDAGGKEDRSVDLGRGTEDRGQFSP